MAKVTSPAIQVLPQYRIYNGKRYRLDEVFTTHTEANQLAKFWRDRGYNARIVRSYGWYLIYIGPKRR